MANIWVENGLSDTIWLFGDNVKFGDAFLFSQARPIFSPDALQTVWTDVSPTPGG